MAAYYTREFGVKPDKIIILYNDIDVRRFAGLRATTSKWSIRRQLGIAEGERLVLFVGRISLSKGGYNVIPVIADVLLQVPRVKCLMIGSILLEDFRDKLAARGLQDSIVLLGAMPNPEVVKYYLAADVLIVPSESEGFPRRLLEAMVLGVPFVSFDVGGVRDIVDQRQLDCIVPARNTALFAQRVVKLLSDEELRQELVQVGFEQVQRYSTERVARMFVDRIVGDSEESAVDMSRAEGGCF
jgi:glycosyltransferase involved in cell wall biosynthesis